MRTAAYSLGRLLVVFCVLGATGACDTQQREKSHESSSSTYFIGTGIHDMTGPAAQINMMGYAKTSQNVHGIHMRLRARTFIVADSSTDHDDDSAPYFRKGTSSDDNNMTNLRRDTRCPDGRRRREEEDIGQLDPEKAICFVSIDAGMGSDLLNTQVLKRLEELLPFQAESGKRLCHLENLSISGTHTHSAPGGFIQYALFQITSAGFSKEVMGAYVEGVAQSIFRAYSNLKKGTVHLTKDRLFDANINRSPTSYMLNPEDEREEYIVDGDTDKRVLQLKFSALNGEPEGILNWYAVHGTSMNASNLLISGDNKGYASYLMEKHVNVNGTLPGNGSFVAAFASTNLGDVSPNTAGPRCLDTGLPCDLPSSTCNGKNALCVAFGPGRTMKESTEIIGRKQFDIARSLLGDQTDPLTGRIAFRHAFINMSNKSVVLKNGEVRCTCPAALGYAFAAGTTDGPGDFDFTQGQNTSSPFWNIMSRFLSPPSAKQKKCHHPKPILLNTGYAFHPYAWDPDSVPISVMKVGNFFILNVPGEFTTMAGRRLRKAIRLLLLAHGIDSPEITIAGLANSYTHYVTTLEEYQGQRYEAASTLYGPHTLLAYIQEFERITLDLIQGQSCKSDHPPKDLSRNQISLIPPIGIDTVRIGRKFGSVFIDANESYMRGRDFVFVSFRSANPRNNQRIEESFLHVDRQQDDGSWVTMYVDADWCTTFFWKSSLESLGASFAEITWTVPSDTLEGTYRICHFGTRRKIVSRFERFVAQSPSWLSIDFMGSFAVGVLLLEMYEVLRSLLVTVTCVPYFNKRSHTEDFIGCSRTFSVNG